MSEATESTTTRAYATRSSPDVRGAIEVAVRLGALLLMVIWCLQIVAPFVGIVVWALIIAIAAESPHEALSRVLGGRRALAATISVVLALLVLFVPAVMLTETLVLGAQHFSEDLTDGAMQIPPPAESVAEWPCVVYC